MLRACWDFSDLAKIAKKDAILAQKQNSHQALKVCVLCVSDGS